MGVRHIAAVDLGSNSFHMVVARVEADQRVVILDRIKEPVQLAAGLNEAGVLSREACERALVTLGRFAERLAELHSEAVLAVGTNTLRQAVNALEFLDLAQDALGHPIAVISGREEARLIYGGVSTAFDRPGRRLVLDIGGGSTELILGQDATPTHLSSLYMGCVSWSRRFFPTGKISQEAMHRAVDAARQELGSVMREYRDVGWDHALGSSGTIKAIEAILMERGLTDGRLTSQGLKQLWRILRLHKRIDRFQSAALPDTRRPVLLGGLAILTAAFKSLCIEELTWVNGALKEGLLGEIVGRMNHEDIREATIERLIQQSGIAAPQAARVEKTALMLFDQAASGWGLHGEVHRPMLGWAARLHEIGLWIAHSGYHKHGAYILQNADLPGFSRQEQAALAVMVLGQRGTLDEPRLRALAPGLSTAMVRLMILLRLAAMMHRTRSRRPLPPVRLEVDGAQILLRYPERWLQDRPLSVLDLESNAAALAALGYTLRFC